MGQPNRGPYSELSIEDPKFFGGELKLPSNSIHSVPTLATYELAMSTTFSIKTHTILGQIFKISVLFHCNYFSMFPNLSIFYYSLKIIFKQQVTCILKFAHQFSLNDAQIPHLLTYEHIEFA